MGERKKQIQKNGYKRRGHKKKKFILNKELDNKKRCKTKKHCGDYEPKRNKTIPKQNNRQIHC